MTETKQRVTAPLPAGRDPLDSWPRFAAAVRERLEAGRAAYGDESFVRAPDALLVELQQEALDLAGWGFVLHERIAKMRTALAAVSILADDD